MIAVARVCKLIYTPAALGLSFDVTIASHVAYICNIQSLKLSSAHLLTGICTLMRS